MISAEEARNEVGKLNDEIKNAEKAINDAISARKYSCHLPYHISDSTYRFVESYGYQVELKCDRDSQPYTLITW